jgi:hypothetical protein
MSGSKNFRAEDSQALEKGHFTGSGLGDEKSLSSVAKGDVWKKHQGPFLSVGVWLTFIFRQPDNLGKVLLNC